MFKRGYENGVQTIEIYEGKIDLVLYNDKPNKPSFYFYRFPSEAVLGEKLSRDVNYVHKKDVASFLYDYGFDYDELANRLLNVAWENNMQMRDEM